MIVGKYLKIREKYAGMRNWWFYVEIWEWSWVFIITVASLTV